MAKYPTKPKMGAELRLFTKVVKKDWHLLCSSSLFAETDKRVIYYVQELQRPCQEFRLAIWKCVENHPTHAPFHSGINPVISEIETFLMIDFIDHVNFFFSFF